MSKTIHIAAIQMDAALAPTPERLQRAERLVGQAADSGARLAVLPELFNTGYAYTAENYKRAEPHTGETAAWMRRLAARYSIHLAGSLMLRDHHEIYNALLLIAPDGRMWRYHKRYPWGWERAYFRGGAGITVASTDLGDIGLLLCWDAAHPNLWRQYAGQVDLVVNCSCPPDVANPTYHFPDGSKIRMDDFGRLGRRLKHSGRLLFGEMVNRQAAWLGVPAVQSVGTGRLRTTVPKGLQSMFTYLPAAPKLARYLSQANRVELECDFVPGCKIVDGRGAVLTELEQAAGETLTSAQVVIGDIKSPPKRPQPRSLLPKIAYLSSDIILPLLMRSVYRQGVRSVMEYNTA